MRVGFGRRVMDSSRRERSVLIEWLVALVAVVLLAGVAIDKGYVAVPNIGLDIDLQADMAVYRFALCSGAGGTCVIDGDTIRIEGQSIRIADIDTPEVRNYACAEEKALGDRATARMLALLNAGSFSMQNWDGRDEDVYGRKLRVLFRNGQSLGMVLVAEGLARPWDGARRSWCS